MAAGLSLPFEPFLDYDTFAVSVPFRDIPRLPTLLGSLSDTAIRAKRERLRLVHRLFLWDAQYGRAYEAARLMLLQTLNGSSGHEGGGLFDALLRSIESLSDGPFTALCVIDTRLYA